MDYLDQQILMKLKENARQSASDISKEIHLSVSTVIDRIRKMESSGVIESYTVITDEKKTGNDVTALMEISLEHPRYNELFIESGRCTSDPYTLCPSNRKEYLFSSTGSKRVITGKDFYEKSKTHLCTCGCCDPDRSVSAYFSIFTYGQRSGTWIIWCIFRMHIYHPGRLLCLHSSLQTQP